LARDIISTSVDEVRIQHVLRGENVRVETLSKLASMKNKGKCRSLLQQTLAAPSTDNKGMNIEYNGVTWMAPYIHYLRTDKIPDPMDNGWTR